MDAAVFFDYIDMYNARDYRRVVDTFYTDDVGVLICGRTMARGAAEMTDWLDAVHQNVLETTVVEDFEFDNFGLEIWAAMFQVLVNRRDSHLDLGRPAQTGIALVLSVGVHYLTCGDRISRILIEPGSGKPRMLQFGTKDLADPDLAAKRAARPLVVADEVDTAQFVETRSRWNSAFR